MIVLWDSPRDKGTWRTDAYPEYKANRSPSPDRDIAISQLPELKGLLRKLRIEQYMVTGLEADDLIGILSRQFPERHVFILSKDSDMMQLVRAGVTVLWPKSGGGVSFVNKLEVRQIEGVNPKQIPSLKALKGDKTDNIKVLPGIGPKKAVLMLSDGLDPRFAWNDLPKNVRAKYSKYEPLWTKVRAARLVAKIVLDSNRAPSMIEALEDSIRYKRAAKERRYFEEYCNRHLIRSLDCEWLGKLW
jgi:5'-3' exonuclease